MLTAIRTLCRSLHRGHAEVFALVMTLASAILLARSGLVLSAENIAETQGLKFGYNSHIVRSLAAQAADTRVGVAVLIASFFLQSWALWATVNRAPAPPLRRNDLAAGIALFLLVLALAFYISSCHAGQLEANAMAILKAPNS